MRVEVATGAQLTLKESLMRITVPTATETASLAIQEAILLGKLKPGQRLVEREN